jgi:hypothetical protein
MVNNTFKTTYGVAIYLMKIMFVLLIPSTILKELKSLGESRTLSKFLTL